MAITIQTSPQQFSPANNPLEFTFSSSSTANENFSFIVVLRINGAVHSYHQVFPEASNYGKFDCSEILRSYVTSQLIKSNVIELSTSTMVATYSIGVKEKYGEPPIEVGSFVDSSTLKTFNASLNKVLWSSYIYTNYSADSDVINPGVYLSYFPIDKYRFCGLNESAFLGFFCEQTGAEITIKTYNSSNTLLQTVTQALTLPTNDFIILDVSPTVLIADTTLTTADFNSAYYYTVAVDSTEAGAEDGDISSVRIYIDRECGLYDGKRLHWLNKLGVWESFTFKLYSEDNAQIEATRYEKNFGAWSGTTRVFNRYEGQNTVISKRSMDNTIINSDWIHQDVQNWLVDSLYNSSQVYLEVSYGVFEPVEVENANYVKKQRIKEGLIQELVRLKRTYKYQSQIN